MSRSDNLSQLLQILGAKKDILVAAYNEGRIYRVEDNAKDIELLKSKRLLTPDSQDGYRLRLSFRRFLRETLSVSESFSIGGNVIGHYERLENVIASYSIAFQNDDQDDCDKYSTEIREAIHDIADTLEDELRTLNERVESRFAAVKTVAEKIRQNKHYQNNAQKILDFFRAVHFSTIEDQLSGHEELVASYKSLFLDRIPRFRSEFSAILDKLNEHLFAFREIAASAKRVRAFDLFLTRNPGWQPKDWHEKEKAEDWLCNAAPLKLKTHEDVQIPESEKLLTEWAGSIAATANPIASKTKPAGKLLEDPKANVTEVIQIPAAQKAIRAYFAQGKKSKEPLSALDWWLHHPVEVGSAGKETWLLRVLAHHDNKAAYCQWKLKKKFSNNVDFDGNVYIHDVFVSAKD